MQIGPETTPPLKASAIWGWYVALCILLALANFGLIALGVYFLGSDAELSRKLNVPPGTFSQSAMLYVVAGTLFGIGNLILPFLPKRAWTYVLHMTNIIAAGLSCCLLPIAIPVFIGWLKPEIKAFFDFR